MITSTGNQQIKEIRKLFKSREARTEGGCFVSEGEKILLEAAEEAVVKVYFSEAYVRANFANEDLAGRQTPEGRPIRPELPEDVFEIVGDSIFEKLSDLRTPPGIITVFRIPSFLREALYEKKAPLILVGEDIQDPGNAGTMIRTAEAAGADAVFFTGKSADPYQPKTVRATMGSIFRMPVFTVPDSMALLSEFAGQGISTYAAYLTGSVSYSAPDYTGAAAFLIGNESRGLKAETAEAAAQRIRIPMRETINSLNAAMAAGILLYEADRQRRAQGDPEQIKDTRIAGERRPV